MIKFFNNIFKSKEVKYYWYDCQFFYKQKGADMYVADFNIMLGFINQRDILNTRKVKKLASHKFKEFPKRILHNGNFYYKVNSYLGHFSK